MIIYLVISYKILYKNHQKSTHFPLISQSPYLVGSGPFGFNPNSGSIFLFWACSCTFSGVFSVSLTFSSYVMNPLGSSINYISRSLNFVANDYETVGSRGRGIFGFDAKLKDSRIILVIIGFCLLLYISVS